MVANNWSIRLDRRSLRTECVRGFRPAQLTCSLLATLGEFVGTFTFLLIGLGGTSPSRKRSEV